MLNLEEKSIIEQKNGFFPVLYEFVLFSLVGGENIDEKGKKSYILDFNNLATCSIEIRLQQIIDDVQNQIINIINDKYEYCIADNFNQAFEKILKYLKQLVNNAKEENKTLILGFSSLGDYIILPELFKIIKELKCIYPNIIFVIGGTDFNNITDEKFVNLVFEGGIDIINVGGADEFTHFFGEISKDDKFYRDEKGELIIDTLKKIPKNFLFLSNKGKISEIIPGGKINTSYYFDVLRCFFHFFIKNNGCLNSCHYCTNYIHDEKNITSDSDIESSVLDFNKYIKEIFDKNLANKKISIFLDNPNPMQFIDRFYEFILNIDLKNAREIGFFADFIGLGNLYKYNKLISIVEFFKEKYSEITVSITFSLDALHLEGDGDFIGRTNGNRLANEEKLQLGYKQFMNFVQNYSEDKRVFIGFNTILHPKMDISLFIERLELIYKLNKIEVGINLLVPNLNSKIYDDHKGYYIEEFEAKKYYDDNEYNDCLIPSLWGYFYLNSYLLDIFVFANSMGLFDLFKNILKENISILEFDIDETKGKMFISFLKWGIQKLEKDNKDLYSVVKLLKNPIGYIKYFFQVKKCIKTYIDYAIYYINYIIEREKYIKENNLNYNYLEIELFLKELEIKKMEYKKLGELV